MVDYSSSDDGFVLTIQTTQSRHLHQIIMTGRPVQALIESSSTVYAIGKKTQWD